MENIENTIEKKAGKTLKQRLVLSLVVGGFFSFGMLVFAPIDVYLGTLREIWFPLSYLLPYILLFFVLAYALIVAVGLLVRGKLFDVYITFVFAVGLALYVQGNYLNNYYGPLDGTGINFDAFFTRGVISVCVCSALLVLPFVLLHFLRDKYIKVMKMVAILIAAMQVVTLGVQFMTVDFHKPSVQRYYSDVDKFTFSKNNNVIVLVLDHYDSVFLNKQFEQNPQYHKDFKDFILYNNHVGSFNITEPALPHMLTGIASKNEKPYDEYLDEAFEQSTLYPLLVENNYKASLHTYQKFLPTVDVPAVTNIKTGKISTTSDSLLSIYFYGMTMYKYLPQPLKPLFAKTYSHEFSRMKVAENIFIDDNKTFWTAAKEQLCTWTEENQYKLYHLNGMHPPYSYDEELTYIGTNKSDTDRMGIGVLRMINAFMDRLKQIGVYDNATIIITADHGSLEYGIKQTPILFVKYANSHFDTMQVTNAPTSHVDLVPTIQTIISGKHEYGKILSDFTEGENRERFFYNINTDRTKTPFYFADMDEYKVGSQPTDLEPTEVIYAAGHETKRELAVAKPNTTYRYSDNSANDFFLCGMIRPWETNVLDVRYMMPFARMNFRLDPAFTGDIGMDIAYCNVSNDSQRIVVKSSGKVIHDQVYTGPEGAVSFTVPADTIEKDGVVRLAIESPDAAQDLRYKGTKETLAYSLLCSSVTFTAK